LPFYYYESLRGQHHINIIISMLYTLLLIVSFYLFAEGFGNSFSVSSWRRQSADCHCPVSPSSRPRLVLNMKITPSGSGDMDKYRMSVRKVLEMEMRDPKKLGGKELLELIIRKWGM
jgi:hypothetical protein